MSSNKQFTITLTERQLKLLAYACRVTDRLIIGQLDFSLQECKLDTAEWRYDKLRMHMDSVYDVYNIHNSYSRIVSYENNK